MNEPPSDAALLDQLYDEDGLYDEDKLLAARELPPRAWRVSQRAVDEILDLARVQLDLWWRQVREQARRDRMTAAFEGTFERRSEPLLTRRGLLARLAALQARHGASVGRAARALDTVDDDELRVWVAELEAQLEACLDGPGAVARTALVSAAASGEGARE